MKKFMTMAVAAIAMVASAGVAEAYQGGWYVDNNRGGSEILYLGDNSDDTYRSLRGTSRYCGRRGASYATMRRVLGNEYDQITWWEDHVCNDGYVRVCVQNSYGQRACSTYEDYGW